MRSLSSVESGPKCCHKVPLNQEVVGDLPSFDDHASTSLPSDQCRNSQSAVEPSTGSGRPFPVSRPSGGATLSHTRYPGWAEHYAQTQRSAHQQRKEGDLIIGTREGSSQIGTMVERTSRFVMLVHLPQNRKAETVRNAIARKIQRLPDSLMRTLTWDQGFEMRQHAQFAIDTGIQVYFCDPHSPWQSGTIENTNGLLRQYFPRGSDFSVLSEADLDSVATELNNRPRKTLHYRTPAEVLNDIVATTS